MIRPHGLPQPDIFVTDRFPAEGLIPAEVVVLVIEVSASTLTFDRTVKADLYAGGAIAEYWVVDIEGGVIHQLSNPSDLGYACSQTVKLGDTVASVTITELAVDTAYL